MDVLADARLIFAEEWARTGGPLTGEVKAAWLVAASDVREADNPDQALDRAAHLAGLSGTWALVQQRRETLYRPQLAAIVKAWRKLARHADLKAAVARYRKALTFGAVDPTEAVDPDQQGERRRRAAEAAAAAVLALHVLVDPNSPDWQAFVDALADGMTVARAEGVAGAIGVAAAHAGATGLDLQHAYDDALTQIDRATITGEAQTAAQGIVRGATTDLTRALTSSDDMSAVQMLDNADNALGWGPVDTTGAADALDALLDATANTAPDLLGDVALSRAFLGGMARWFGQWAVRYVDFVTVAGACPICEDIAAQNPWLVSEVPQPQIHPRCRCSLSPTSSPFGFDYTQYLP